MKQDRIQFAKLMIFNYVNELWTRIPDLAHPSIEELTNLPSHGLRREELVVVLYELFQSHMLVAMNQSRGLFTPTLQEIESALDEEVDCSFNSTNTFYGLTTGANELLKALKSIQA